MKVLVVAPHPDDADLGMGGSIKQLLIEGNSVDVLYLTRGEHGCPDIEPEEAGEVRTKEAYNAAKELGYNILEFWDLPDGSVRYTADLKNRLARLIEIGNYQTVYVTHEQESHPDHRAAGRLVREALKTWLANPPECLTYEVWTPLQTIDKVINVTDTIDNKLRALDSHASQMSRQDFDKAILGLNRYRGIMYGKSTYAEAFSKMRLNGAAGMNIALMLLTYAPTPDHARAEYAYKTLESTLINLDVGPNNTLHVHIADDGSDKRHVQNLLRIAREYGYEPTYTNAERGGYGKSYNLACQALHDSYDVILPLEDDWELTKPLKLEYLIKALEENPGEIRSIRLGYLGITQPLIGTVAFRSGMTYLLLHPESPEPHVFCGHPRLDTVSYQRAIGPWPEGTRAGDTEWEITHRTAARIGVAWPLDINLPASQDWGCYFAHIGSVSFNQDIPEGAKA